MEEIIQYGNDLISIYHNQFYSLILLLLVNLLLLMLSRFGHYPTSCIIASGGVSSVRSLIGRYSESVAYVCGHLHRMGGLVPTMYTIQKLGFLELELGDWKDNRMYGIEMILSYLTIFYPKKNCTGSAHAE